MANNSLQLKLSLESAQLYWTYIVKLVMHIQLDAHCYSCYDGMLEFSPVQIDSPTA